MWILLTALAALGLIAALLGLLSRHDGSDVVTTGSDCATCDGSSEQCEQTCMMEASLKEIEYFDDEELDAYSGRRSDGYSAEEAERFREVLYTMRPDEVRAWTRSLTLRGISLPDEVKDETFMLMEG